MDFEFSSKFPFFSGFLEFLKFGRKLQFSGWDLLERSLQIELRLCLEFGYSKIWFDIFLINFGEPLLEACVLLCF